MNIQILSVEVNNAMSKGGKPYEQVVVAYKDLSNGGKVASKTVMPFGFQKDAFTTLKGAKPVEVYDVDVQKNDAGYNDWIKVTKGTATTASTVVGDSTKATATAATTTKGGWETPEERAKKQVYIIRQSSVANAVAALIAGAKTPPKAEDIINLAKQFENYVLDVGTATKVAKQDVGAVESFDDSLDQLPF